MIGKFIVVTLIALASCKTSESPVFRQIAYPKLVNATYRLEPKGIYLELDFEKELEMDSLDVVYYVQLNTNAYSAKYVGDTVASKGVKKLNFFLDKSYISGLSYDSLLQVKNEDLLGRISINARPVGSGIVLMKQAEHRERKDYPYFNCMIYKKRKGLKIVDSLSDYQKKGYIMQVPMD